MAIKIKQKYIKHIENCRDKYKLLKNEPSKFINRFIYDKIMEKEWDLKRKNELDKKRQMDLQRDIEQRNKERQERQRKIDNNEDVDEEEEEEIEDYSRVGSHKILWLDKRFTMNISSHIDDNMGIYIIEHKNNQTNMNGVNLIETYGTLTENTYRLSLSELLEHLANDNYKRIVMVDYSCNGVEQIDPIYNTNAYKWIFTIHDHQYANTLNYGGI